MRCLFINLRTLKAKFLLLMASATFLAFFTLRNSSTHKMSIKEFIPGMIDVRMQPNSSKTIIPPDSSKTITPPNSSKIITPTQKACVQPILELNDPVMKKFYRKISPVNCKAYYQDMVYVDNGTLGFNESPSPHTKCDMYPLIRDVGDKTISYGKPVTDFQDKTPLLSEYFKVVCSEKNKEIYNRIHIGVHFNKTIKDRIRETKLPANGLQLSVVMLGFDSMSRMSWLRRLPKTRQYFVNELGAIELEAYNIMGDGTPAALLPMLTGRHEDELPDARKSKGGKPVDHFPFIWKEYQKNGYVTSLGDAAPTIGPFNYRLRGFTHQPTDYFTRPYYLAASPMYQKFKRSCYGSFQRHEVWFNFVKDLFKMYKDDPKFFFHFYAGLSHGDNNPITMADDDIYQLVHFLEAGGYLDNTLFVLFGDHGCRFSNVRVTFSGKVEERMPYFAFRFPKWFHEKHPDIIRNFKTNVNRLSTPLDIHETLKDILNFDGTGRGNLDKRAISLFKEIPLERTCAHANIAPHWCACMSWKSMHTWDKGVQGALQAAIDTINDFTKDYREYCALLRVKNVTSSYKSEVGDSFLRFKQTTGDRGIIPVLSAQTKSERALYQLTFVTAPSNGEFEVTIQHDLAKNKFSVGPKDISRINKYGDAPYCILDKNRDIRQYCYCQQK